MSKYAVIIAAAGKSERFGGSEKKTFAKLSGRPVFLRTLEHFITRKDVCQTILAVAPEDMDTVRTKFGPNVAFMGVKLIEGGDHRCKTVAAALREVVDEAEFVAIHDAVRPCVTADWIDAVFAEAAKCGAAILASRVTSTLKRASGANVIEETVLRTGLLAAQTPQVFRKELLQKVYESLPDDLSDITDDSQLVETSGHPVSVVISDETNIKITTKGDLTLAAAIIKSRPAKSVQRFGAFEEAQW